ncbi:MAG: DNA recombination protein RmuC [Candidatus Omnitrophota bacterium]
MNWLFMIIGAVVALALAYIFKLTQAKAAREIAAELFRESEAQRKSNIDEVIKNVKESFGNLSLEALSKSTDEFLKLAKVKIDSEKESGLKELEAKKGLIDQQLARMVLELDKVSVLMKGLENDRVEKFGELANQLKVAGEHTQSLMQTTGMLREALVSSKARGQWGERMAEDVLRLAGFIENVNYLSQKSIEGIGSRPDFTFLLPRNLKVNMDVKFPLDNYVRYLEVKSEVEKTKFRNDFLRDVKAKIKEVTSREYINPEQNTLDYVLLFIPNEQVYSFIHEQDPALLDEGIKNKVIFCSPVTLFAILAVVRQAVDNFALEHASNEILSLFGAFRKQWVEFAKRLEALGERIEQVHKEYDALAITRRRQLEKPLERIEFFRTQRSLPSAGEDLKFIDLESEEEKVIE